MTDVFYVFSLLIVIISFMFSLTTESFLILHISTESTHILHSC